MKKYNISILLAILCLLSTIFIYPTSASASQKPQDITISHKKLTLYVGEFEQIQVTSVKTDNTSDKVIWKSKNKKIASVTAKGKVTAKKSGKTEIIAISKENANVRKSIKVTVKQKPKQAEKELIIKGGIYALGNYSSTNPR